MTLIVIFALGKRITVSERASRNSDLIAVNYSILNSNDSSIYEFLECFDKRYFIYRIKSFSSHI